LGGTGRQISEFKARLVYKMSYRTKKNKKNKKKKEKKREEKKKKKRKKEKKKKKEEELCLITFLKDMT
jgi:flagellar biosynthesis component FlhA